ncbi:hybrid sensor histidine kinase/response regulator transcription factor [Massilibacteroides sp.]|uniref:hybrid sensor histidine kinase/response regulator transcription factor n=1 Tax=Massilibacteroides sp. TaxID=2034766 RepID=UPI00261B5CB8|nr:hybrid sensor histidine kinase/response regulator transcription factor [Massilibacteroides sp.]MDD4515168.1 two-component regulator propeller domain-containing protein [Massilibacteroides sp.]
MIKRISLFFCFLLIPISVFAYNLRQITNRDGLSNSAILSISQDKDGIMWFGSCDGLNIYNGVNIRLYNPDDASKALSGNLIEHIIQSNDGTLWVHTNYGLDRLDPFLQRTESFEQFKGVYHIQKDNSNGIYIINSDDSIHYYNNVKRAFDTLSLNRLSYTDILDFVITDNNILQIITKKNEHPAYKIQKNAEGEITLKPVELFEHDPNLLYCFHEQENSNILYFIDNEFVLYEYDALKKKTFYVRKIDKKLIDKGTISSIIKFNNEYFIGFKTNGLIALKKKSPEDKHYVIEEINVNSGVFCLLKDQRQDILWIGTDGQGVYMYSQTQYSIQSYEFSLFYPQVEKPVRALWVDKQDNLWIGTKGDGLLKLKTNNNQHSYITPDGEIEHFREDNSELISNSVYVLDESKRDICWIGTEEGLNYFSYKSKKIEKTRIQFNGQDIKYIHALKELPDNSLWIATVGMGVFRFDIEGTQDRPVLANPKQIIKNTDEESHNYFFTLYQENDSVLWFGNRGYGAFRVLTNTLEVFPTSIYTLSSFYKQTMNDVFSIYKDELKNIWLGTSDGLVKRSESGQLQVFNTKTGFLNNTIHSILADQSNNLWMSTNKGIVKFNMTDQLFQTYTEHNGLQVIEFSDGASFYDKKREVFLFGGINGFITISDTRKTIPPFSPEVKFDKFILYGEEVNLYDFLEDKDSPTHIGLRHNQNFFSLSFVTLDYVNSHNYTCYYQLNPLSDSWIDNGISNTIPITGLTPGNYTLNVKFINRLTGQESSVYRMEITIHVPWYASRWAVFFYSIAIISVLVLLIRSARIKEHKRKAREKEKQEVRHREEVYESKLRFFTNIAHEFCTPLALIYGPCSRILSRYNIDPFIKNYTEIIQRNAVRLNDLIQDLIEFRRIETGNKKPQIEQLNIEKMSNDILTSFHDLLESKKIHLETAIAEDMTWNTDSNFFYTILSNLLSNAHKYTPEGGLIRVSLIEQDDKLIITVANSGKGILPKDFDRIFDRYVVLDNFEKQESKNILSRNGLGLAISYSMVKLLGGEIEATNSPDNLTNFIVTLPELEASKSTLNLDNESRKSLSQEMRIPNTYVPVKEESTNITLDKNKPTALLIDDDEEMLWLLNETLSHEYNVIKVNDPTQVESLLERIHPDIILSDVMMTGLDGIRITQMVKQNKKTAHIPVVLISASHSTDTQIKGLESGAEMYITKPFNPEVLKSTIKQMVTRKEILKDYYSSPLSAFEMIDGDLTHKEDIRFIQDIYDIIDKNITNKELSAEFIANELHISPRHLYRKLSTISKKSLSEIIKDSRLYISQNLLLNTQLTVDEILYRSGYTNRSTFFRVFSAKFGCTPKEYRDKHMAEREK